MALDPMNETGTREELIAKLRGMSEGWYRLAKDKLSRAASEAADALGAGSDVVQVGHTIYTVVDAESAAE